MFAHSVSVRRRAASPELSTREASHNWGVFAVRDVEIPGLPPLSFEVPPGGVLAVSGPSGSGKTRLLRALADLDPHRGSVRWGERTCAAVPAPEWRRRVGLLPAEPRFWRPVVSQHFPEDGASLAGELAGLRLDPEVRNADPALLSTGERSRLALLRLLLNAPEVLLLDEPTANLDRDNRALVIERIDRYRKERDAPVVWVSHLPEVVAAADRVLVLPAGEVRGLPDPGRAPVETPA